MTDVTCPWCESELAPEPVEQRDGQTCPECLTTWSYVEEAASELAIAA